MWYIIVMKKESIYKVTLVDGPASAIMPIKAYDAAHAVRIAASLELDMRIVGVTLACDDSE